MENRRGRKQGTTNKVMDMDEDCRIEMRFEIVERQYEWGIVHDVTGRNASEGGRGMYGMEKKSEITKCSL
jgi:hypothetical protein